MFPLEFAMSAMRAGILMLGAVVALSGAGCGGSNTVPVKGVVTFDGKPLPNATVLFIPQEPGGRDAHGTTDDDGVFVLSTAGSADGALPGAYKVTVHYSEPATVPPTATNPADVQKAMAKKTRKPSLVLPPIYCQPDKTVLKHRVPDDGDVKLELKSAAR
jgi:hypothetical protein